MTKEKELFDASWKGYLQFDEYSEKEKQIYKKEYSPNEIMDMLKYAYNKGIEDAVDCAKVIDTENPFFYEPDPGINTEEILKLKIK